MATDTMKFYATGRRKRAIARVWLFPGEGKIIINNRDADAYLARPTNLKLIEQPLNEDDIWDHRLLQAKLRAPICLDESILSAAGAADAIDRGACSIVNIKAGRVGGYLEAVRVHDACVERDVPVWCGGMVETGLGRAANVALAALPGFTLPGDTSGSDRFFTTDLTEPLVLRDGGLDVPTTPGLGVTPIPELLERFTTHTEWLRPE